MCQGYVCAPVIETTLELSDGTPRQELHKYICKISIDNNLRSFPFTKYLVVLQNWFGIFMIFYDFGEFCNISVFIEKEKNERKRKMLA